MPLAPVDAILVNKGPISGTQSENSWDNYYTIQDVLSLVGNPAQVVSTDGSVTITNTGSVDEPVWDLQSNHVVDINVSNFSYDTTTKEILR